MYKAIKEIGGYKIGEEVPADKAEVWLKMYSVPQVEKVTEEETQGAKELKGVPNDITEEEAEKADLESSKNVMFDDYLSRNKTVVKKNIEDDDLSQKQLKGLLELEESDKKRKVIIEAIKLKLNKIRG